MGGLSFDTCASCPTGFYPTSSLSDPGRCPTYGNFRTHCEKVAGSPLLDCEDACPKGYVPTALYQNILQCGGAYKELQTQCTLIAGDTLRTCETGCPDGFYPTSTSFNPQCAVRYAQIETQCAKTQGPTITSCGIGCPPGYFLTQTVSKPSCGGVYLNLASICSTSNPQGPVITVQPRSATITAGQTASLTVQATGQPALTYQWYIGASGDRSRPISGATNPTVNVTPAATTSYWVLVKNQHGEVASDTATVTVNPACVAPHISVQPQAAHILAGQSATLDVQATGTSLQHQWYKGTPPNTTSAVPGGTAPSVTVTPPSTASYWVRVKNTCGSVDSSPATVTVDPVCQPPAITTQPQPAFIDQGQPATLSAAASGTSPSFQWYDGESGDTSHPVAGGNAASIQVTPAATTRYWMRATSACGQADSLAVTVTVTPACISPSISTQPQPVTIDEGQTASLTVLAGGTTLAYQWYEGTAGDTSRPVSGTNGAQLFVSPSGSTSYWAHISNSCGSADSDSAAVTVNPACQPPAITAQPQSVSIVDGESATLQVDTQGTAPAFQWYEGAGTNFPVIGGINATLVVSPHTTTTYFVRATNGCGSADSNFSTVTVAAACVPPGITVPPAPASINPGQSATLAVTASGTSPSFQWYIGESGDTANQIPGATASSIAVSPAATTTYWVRISNDCGSFDSGSVTVTVTPLCMPPALITQPHSTTIDLGQSATLVTLASGTSPSYQWYQGFQGDVSQPVPGGVGSSLVVTPATTTSYWVFVQNACGSNGSVSATVTVVEPCNPPQIFIQPQSVTIDAGQVAILGVDATGADSYQWYQGASGDTLIPVPGANGSSVVVSPPSTASYWVRLFNNCGLADSNAATVTVNIVGCGPDGASCGGDGNHTCQGGQCICSNCGSSVCCGTAGNAYCDGQQYFDPNVGYFGACASTLSSCDSSNDFDGGNAVFHDGEIRACVNLDGVYGWWPRRPSPRCQELNQVCDYVCSSHYNDGSGLMCDQTGTWNQSPPLPYCYGGTIPDTFLCQ